MRYTVLSSIIFITIVLVIGWMFLNFADCEYIPVIAVKESSGLSPILTSVECSHTNLCNASVELNHYLDTAETCCSSTKNGTGIISKMRLSVLNEYGHFLWGAIFNIGQKNDSWIDSEHLFLTSDGRQPAVVDAMSYPLPQEFSFYGDVNRTLTIFTVVLSKGVSYYLLGRELQGSALPTGVTEDVSILEETSFQPSLGTFKGYIEEEYLLIELDGSSIIGNITIQVVSGGNIKDMDCDKQWYLEYNVISCGYYNSEFFNYNYSVTNQVQCSQQHYVNIYVGTISASCIKIYPQFQSGFNFKNAVFSIEIIGPKGTEDFVRGSELVIEEYWTSEQTGDISLPDENPIQNKNEVTQTSNGETSVPVIDIGEPTLDELDRALDASEKEIANITISRTEISAAQSSNGIYQETHMVTYPISDEQVTVESFSTASTSSKQVLSSKKGNFQNFTATEVSVQSEKSMTASNDQIEISPSYITKITDTDSTIDRREQSVITVETMHGLSQDISILTALESPIESSYLTTYLSATKVDSTGESVADVSITSKPESETDIIYLANLTNHDDLYLNLNLSIITVLTCHSRNLLILDMFGRQCQCHCRGKFRITDAKERLERKVNKIVKRLVVDKNVLSSTTRKKTSASDPRKSAQAMGAIGVSLLVTVGGLIMSLDIPHIIDFIVTLKHKLTISIRRI